MKIDVLQDLVISGRCVREEIERLRLTLRLALRTFHKLIESCLTTNTLLFNLKRSHFSFLSMLARDASFIHTCFLE